MLADDQRRLLGEFIRTHRERARPQSAGGRRRTPGLRREELAAPLDETLYFAGEATDIDESGTVGGALASGIRAAKEIIRGRSPK